MIIYKNKRMNKKQVITIINYIINGIFWILAITFLLFDILGVWKLWNIVGYGSLLYLFITIPSLVIAIIISIKDYNKKYLILNIVASIVTIIFVIINFFVSSNWFW